MSDSVRLDGPRPAGRKDQPGALAVANHVLRTLNNHRPPTVGTDWPHVYGPGNADNILVSAAGSQIVGTVGIWTNEVQLGSARLKAGGVNCLAVLPEFRRHGVGAQLMEAAHAHMQQRGCHVGELSTQITAWYRKLGWELAAPARTFAFNRSNIGLLPEPGGRFTFRVAGEEALRDVIRIGAADRLGGVRDLGSFRNVWAARGRHGVALAEEDGRPSAYLMGNDRHIVEWAGPAPTLARLLRAWFEGTDNVKTGASDRDDAFRSLLRTEMLLTAPGGGHPFIDLLLGVGIPCSVGYVGMLRVLNPRAILDAFGLRDIAVADRGATLEFSRGREGCVLSRPLAAKLLFGPERVNPFAHDVLPLPFWQWPVEHV